MKRFILCLAAAACLLSLSAQHIYNIKVKDADGSDVALSRYKGKVVLIVNTATHCGFTPQYKELEKLYQSYAKDGLEILDFPCNQFGGQAPGTMQEIRQFCTEKYDTHFPQFEKIDVNGQNASPLFTYLKSQKGFGGFDPTDRIGQLLDKMLREKNPDYAKSSDIMWNFTKFLVSRDGRVVKRYEPTEKIQVIEADVKACLAGPKSVKKGKR
jgi:glutathione peroxidase